MNKMFIIQKNIEWFVYEFERSSQYDDNITIYNKFQKIEQAICKCVW